MDLNDLTFKIRRAAFTVHNELGPGLLESVYEATLAYELINLGLNVRTQVPLPVVYKEIKLDLGFRIDLLVEDSVIVEIKSIELLHDVHKKQLLTYLRLSDKKLGLLINFNSIRLVEKETIIRIIN
ncbi:GxxExxY protein [Algoriphagus boseongensis]|uniref:GxxExxY protein n=1 Tax=Algoriphagus boseongensis TaxID=1442587 RepID=A0A4R6T5U9_9BACT|nr:GxxExxY protein [Algoriphagus boseongensis]TDQ18290.1 GxxExxY protein [Algoriphagus boseongensis]